MKRNILITVGLIVLIVLFVCLKSLWEGFMYFSLSFLSLLSLYWLFNYIIYYLEDYYYNFESDFIEYKAELINSTSLTSQEIENDLNQYIKKYKKSIRKYKLIDITKILFFVMVFVICMVSMAKGEFLL